MDCPECQFENEINKKFCTKCGTKLSPKCPDCASEIGAEDVFCGECGRNLTVRATPSPQALTPDDKVAKIQRYLPQGLADKILSQRDRIEGERKQVTVMFCDLKGFTAVAEKLGPEGAFGLMDPIYEILIHGTQEYGGTVNEMTGDGIMALFGAPVALEDAPQRAIRAAIAIHREMVRFNDKMKQDRPGLPAPKMRIGIHTGPVVVGTLGNDLRVEFKAVGDTVNLASRMEGLAEPGTTYVSGETFKLTEGLFRFEGLGEKEVQGKEKPVSVYRVIAPSTRRTRFEVAAERGLTPFVGRQRELELLHDALDRAKDGHGQAVSIVAPAGDGKSRTLYEFRKDVVNEDVTFLEGKCLSYSRGVTYHPVIDILRGNFDIGEDDGDEVVRDKVLRGLKILGADDEATAPYLLELLSVKDSGIENIPMSPEARKDRTIQALTRIVLKGSEIRPLVLSVEDLHWMDKTSEDVFKDLLERIAGARVLLLFTYRPEYQQTWGGRSYHSQVNLNRLSNRETVAMVTHLLGTESVPENLASLVLQKTEGVPFFVEEFLKSLKDLQIIERRDHTYVFTKDWKDVAIPSTIQDVLMARVDALPDGAKEVLQTGAVIEREFPHELLLKVTGLPEPELLSHLATLKDAELLYERGVFPQSIYIFKHALTREVVYDSILSKRRTQLHGTIGATLEELHKEDLHEPFEILSEHFIAGESYAKGAEYARFAAKRAKDSGSFVDAVSYSEKRISCLEKLPQSAESLRKIIDARTTLGLYLTQTTDFVAAKEAIEPILDAAVTNGYSKRIPQIYAILTAYYLMAGDDSQEALCYGRKALEMATTLGDMNSKWASSYWLGSAQIYSCEWESGHYNYNRSLDITVSSGRLVNIAAMQGNVSWAYSVHGKIDLAYQISLEAFRSEEEAGDVHSAHSAEAHISHGAACYGKRLLQEAETHLRKGADLCARIDLFAWHAIALDYLGRTYLERSEYDKCIDCHTERISILERRHHSNSLIIFSKMSRTSAQIKSGQQDINLNAVRHWRNQSRMKYVEGPIRRITADILLGLDDRYIAEAEEWIQKAIESDKEHDVRLELAMDHVLYGELLVRKGEPSTARQQLHKAIEVFQECGADGWVQRTEEKLARW